MTFVASIMMIACTDPLAKRVNGSDSSVGKPFVGISSVVPSGGPLAGGTRLRILGQGFTIDTKVKLGTLDCSNVSYISIDEVDCTTPGPNATSESLSVTVTNANGATFTLTDGFTYRPAPTVTSVSPALGRSSGGNAVTVTGTGFVAGATVVLSGSGCANATVVSPTSITCTTTAHTAGLVTASVTNTDSQSASLTNAFDYRIEPVVTAISPIGGDVVGGTAVTITGSNFLSGVTVAIGGANCASVVLVNANTITCTTGAHAAATSDVVVTNSNSMSFTLAAAYTYSAPPTVTSISPAIGALAGGTSVTITGTGFSSGIVAKIDGVNCGTLALVNATTLTCLTPGSSRPSNSCCFSHEPRRAISIESQRLYLHGSASRAINLGGHCNL